MRLYQPSDLPFAQEVLESAKDIFEGWEKTPDFSHFLTYVVEGQGLVVLEALGGGEYLASSCFLPHARGAISGKYIALATMKAFLETDATSIWGVADNTNHNGVNALRFFKDKPFAIDTARTASKLDFLRWVAEDKSFAKEVDQWQVDIPHKKMLYAVLKCAENGWGMKGFRQWYIYERLAKDVPNIMPMNVDFTILLCGNNLLSLSAETPSVKINL